GHHVRAGEQHIPRWVYDALRYRRLFHVRPVRQPPRHGKPEPKHQHRRLRPSFRNDQLPFPCVRCHFLTCDDYFWFSLENSTSSWWGGGLLYVLYSDLQSQVFESFHKVAFQLRSIDPVKIVCSQFTVGLFGLEHMIQNDQNAMGYSDNCPLLPLAGG